LPPPPAAARAHPPRLVATHRFPGGACAPPRLFRCYFQVLRLGQRPTYFSRSALTPPRPHNPTRRPGASPPPQPASPERSIKVALTSRAKLQSARETKGRTSAAFEVLRHRLSTRPRSWGMRKRARPRLPCPQPRDLRVATVATLGVDRRVARRPGEIASSRRCPSSVSSRSSLLSPGRQDDMALRIISRILKRESWSRRWLALISPEAVFLSLISSR
jgi:hypothetical protein